MYISYFGWGWFIGKIIATIFLSNVGSYFGNFAIGVIVGAIGIVILTVIAVRSPGTRPYHRSSNHSRFPHHSKILRDLYDKHYKP